MTTVMPPEVQACIDGIPPGHRPLSERLHRLILTASRRAGNLVVQDARLQGREPASVRRRLEYGILVCGWQKDRDGGFTSRHPELVTSKRTRQLRDGDAVGISDEDFLGLARRPGP